MSDFLFGSEESGTPVETRRGTTELAQLLRTGNQEGFASMMAPFHRVGAQGFQSMFGFDPASAGVGDVVQDLLASPEDRTAGLFSSMEPFERRETARQVEDMRSMFGTVGGRFGTGAMTGETELRGELAQRFARSREEALLAAEELRSNVLSSVMQMANQSRSIDAQNIGNLLSFFAPGAPVQKQGALGGLISTAGNIWAINKMMNRGDEEPGLPGGAGLDPNSGEFTGFPDWFSPSGGSPSASAGGGGGGAADTIGDIGMTVGPMLPPPWNIIATVGSQVPRLVA